MQEVLDKDYWSFSSHGTTCPVEHHLRKSRRLPLQNIYGNGGGGGGARQVEHQAFNYGGAGGGGSDGQDISHARK